MNDRNIIIGLFVALVISVSFNIQQHLVINHLTQAKQTVEAKVENLNSYIDRVDAETNQRQDIEAELQARNHHVPKVILANWAASIQRASQEQQIPVPVLMSLYKVESALVHYDTRGFITISNKNAGGLGQIMPFWYKACPYSNRPDDLDNASVNIMCSAFILRHYLNENKQDLFLALTAYNAGPRGVKLMLHGRDITQGYAKKILQRITT